MILKKDELIITFRKPVDSNPQKKMAWDLNLLSIDGFWDKGLVRIDLKPLYKVHITYESIRRKIQRMSKKKPKALP